MPTELAMQNLQTELENIAVSIKTDSDNLFTATSEMETLESELEEIRAEAMRTILQNKQMFPNEDWRKIGARDAESADTTAHDLKTDIHAKKQIVSELKSQLEKSRKLYRSKELLMLFYANH